MKKIEDLKKGDLFKLNSETEIVRVHEGYNGSTRKYSYCRFDDVSSFRQMKKGTKVFVDFEF